MDHPGGTAGLQGDPRDLVRVTGMSTSTAFKDRFGRRIPFETLGRAQGLVKVQRDPGASTDWGTSEPILPEV